ncbi:cyclin-dependent kinase 4 inhibitor C [Sardina pilchardus]|uniref:cyclin-dependent kinase 4 inhibitor C n=1 Tax=Sardina pilchardus TaxID=27697 RepID=UPI002E0ED772
MAGRTQADRLTTASARGDLSEVEMILQNGADVNEKNILNRTAIQVMKLGNPAIADALLRANADPNVRDPVLGLTIAHDASRDGFLDTLRVLVHHGADVNLSDNGGNLPLHLAAREGHLDVVQFLAPCTSDPSQLNGSGRTPCDLARLHNRSSAAQWLETFVFSQQN